MLFVAAERARPRQAAREETINLRLKCFLSTRLLASGVERAAIKVYDDQAEPARRQAA